jgi:hypothetical protein
MKKSSSKGLTTNSLRLIKPRYRFVLLLAGAILIVLIWLLFNLFEGENPQARLEPLPEYVNKSTSFTIMVSDKKMGLRNMKVSVKQDGLVTPVLERDFPYEGVFNRRGIHKAKEEFTVDPKKLNLVQGQANLIIEIHDFSKRRGGDGNLSLLEHKMIVDTIPPSIAATSRGHNITIGGSGLIVYRTSIDACESGVLVNDLLFPGVPLSRNPQSGVYVCYFALPYDCKQDTPLYLWAKDRADNETKKAFSYYIRPGQFRSDKITISDRFLNDVISRFAPDSSGPAKSKIEQYLLINRKLRQENDAVLRDLCKSPTEEKLWDGPWIRMKKAATMATFGEERAYYYKGKVVDKTVHLGVDLASLAASPVQAANTGRVIFAQDLGIYGQTVVLEHGQGLYTMYGHLSRIDVAVDQLITKGDIIGTTGQTGLTTGDHLHFGFMVHGVFVNPVEWWDAHWIKDNIYRKLNMAEGPGER